MSDTMLVLGLLSVPFAVVARVCLGQNIRTKAATWQEASLTCGVVSYVRQLATIEPGNSTSFGMIMLRFY